MALDATVVVATFGDGSWRALARERAIPSAVALGLPCIHHHAETLHEARNGGLAGVRTEWVIHLDADDELEPGYVAAMTRGTADVRAPAVRYVYNGRPLSARMPRVAGHAHCCVARCLLDGNWLVIGSLVRTELVLRMGGWRDFSWSEDWDLWLRCHLAGASIQAIPHAVYRAHARRDSRNRGASQEERLAAHRAIAAANGVPAP